MRVFRPILRLLAAMLVLSVLLSLVVLPFVFTSTASLAEMTRRLEEMPPLPDPPLPQRSTLLASDGTLLAHVFLENRQNVSLDEVAPVMVDAIVAVEDARFFEHSGVDFKGVTRALLVNKSSGETVQGASTITQQYVKNVLIQSATTAQQEELASVKTVERKLREVFYARKLETELSKNEILERYLNIAYFGSHAYGIQAAALTFFGVPASQLTLAQSATLAGLVKAPSFYDPHEHPERALERRNLVLRTMEDQNKIAHAEARDARMSDLAVLFNPPSNGCAPSPYPFYCDWVLSTLPDSKALGATPDERARALANGNLVLTTSLDPKVQADVQQAVDRIPRDNRVAAVSTVVEPGSGLVKALAVNRNYGTDPGQTVVPLATNPFAPGGSTFKVFALTAALEESLPLSTVLPAGNTYQSDIFENPPRGFFTNAADGAGTNVTIDEATRKSINTAFVQLSELVSVPTIVDTASRLGLKSLPDPASPEAPKPTEGSFTLGARNASVLELTNVYATIAASGLYCEPQPLLSVAVPKVSITTVSPDCQQAVDPAVANTVAAVLASAVVDGTGHRAAIDRPLAGKTGTSQNYGSAWFVGFTPQLSAAVLLADPRGVTYPLTDVLSTPRVFGGTLPAEIFSQAMLAAHAGLPVQPLPSVDPAYRIAVGPSLTPDVNGLSLPAARSVLAQSGFKVKVTYTKDVPGGFPPDTVASTYPPPLSRLDHGSVVEVFVSPSE